MLPKTHAILGIIFSIVVFFIFNISIFQTLLIFFASFLIDFDHYMWYVYKKNEYSVKKAYFWFKGKRKKWFNLSKKERDKYKRPFLVFHSIEFWIILVLLSFINKIFLFILIGVLFHMTIDYIEIFRIKERFYPKFSLLWVFIKNEDKPHFLLFK